MAITAEPTVNPTAAAARSALLLIVRCDRGHNLARLHETAESRAPNREPVSRQ
jgi:hypothetical protein